MNVEENLERALVRLQADLDALKIRWAVVGGLAGIMHGTKRFTEDLDVAVVVVEGEASDRLIRNLRERNYRHLPGRPLFHDDEPLRELRFRSPEGVRVDLILDWSGIELETVDSAEAVVRGSITVPVCRAEYFLALKVHAGRDKDLGDVRELLKILEPAEVLRARDLLDRIARKTSANRTVLQRRLSKLIAEQE